MKAIKILILSLCLIVGLSTCKKKCCDPNNPDCENYDPCYEKKTINTHFLVRQGNGSFPPNPPECGENLPCDTIQDVWAEFEVPKGNTDNCTYEWIIGTQTKTFASKKFQLSFSNWLRQGNLMKPLPITLKIRRPLDGCNTMDDTLKVVTRNIYFIHDTATVKKYAGYFEHLPNVKDTLTIFKTDVNYTFRGKEFQMGVSLLIGLPTATNDTCLNGGTSGTDCGRGYRYGYSLITSKPVEISGYLTSVKMELIAFETWRFTYGVAKPGYPNQYVFIGNRIYK